MNGLALSSEKAAKRFGTLNLQKQERGGHKVCAHQEHDEYGETALYPLSPVNLSLFYFEFMNESDIA